MVLVRYSENHDFHQEIVYNRADIDGASIVWANDFGPNNNRNLLNYYQDRKVWVLEPDSGSVKLYAYE